MGGSARRNRRARACPTRPAASRLIWPDLANPGLTPGVRNLMDLIDHLRNLIGAKGMS